MLRLVVGSRLQEGNVFKTPDTIAAMDAAVHVCVSSASSRTCAHLDLRACLLDYAVACLQIPRKGAHFRANLRGLTGS